MCHFCSHYFRYTGGREDWVLRFLGRIPPPIKTYVRALHLYACLSQMAEQRQTTKVTPQPSTLHPAQGYHYYIIGSIRRYTCSVKQYAKFREAHTTKMVTLKTYRRDTAVHRCVARRLQSPRCRENQLLNSPEGMCYLAFYTTYLPRIGCYRIMIAYKACISVG